MRYLDNHQTGYFNAMPLSEDTLDNAAINEEQFQHSFLFIRSPRILLVEDQPIIQLVHTDMLTQLGATYDIANNGLEAVTAAGKGRYDLILMDIGLPKMDGIAATKLIRSQEPRSNRNIIVAVTAFGDVVEKECLEAGIDDFYTKPIPFEGIANILVRWLPHLLSSAENIPSN